MEKERLNGDGWFLLGVELGRKGRVKKIGDRA
jgi:hypothetical protein